MKKRNPKPKVHTAMDDDIEEWMVGQPSDKNTGTKKNPRIRKGETAAAAKENHRDV